MAWPVAQKPLYGTDHEERCARCVSATENIDHKAQRDEASRLLGSEREAMELVRHERDTDQKRAETYLAKRDAAIAEAGRWKALLSEAQRDLAAARKARDEARWACAKVEGCIDAHETQERIQAHTDAMEVHRAQQEVHPRHPTTLDVEAASRHAHWRWLEACEAALNGKDWEGLRQLRSIGPLLISG